MRRATAKEKAAHRGLYPLHSLHNHDGLVVAVEDLRGSWSSPDPTWEIRAPEGYHFGHGELTHGLLEHSLADVRERLTWIELVKCHPGCGCGCEYDTEN